MEYISHNGKLIPESNATVSILNKALFFNFAVYESVKVVKGQGFHLDYHVDRLLNSAQLIELDHDFAKDKILLWLKDLVEKSQRKDLLIRILLLGSAGPDEESRLFMFPLGLTFYPDRFYKQGVKVTTYEGERLVPQAKSKDLLLNYLAYREAQKLDALDALLIDKDGNLREGTRSNLFAVKGNQVVTPSKEKVLEGITRRLVIEAVEKLPDLELIEQDIPFGKVKDYDAFFITSTSMNVMPIKQIDDVYRSGEVHPIVKAIIRTLKKMRA
jgi:branched-chain amino acid aminotransferase